MAHIQYNASPTLTQFHKSDAFVRGIRGPVGCVAPDTLIVTSCGYIPVSKLAGPAKVLSWNSKAGEFQFSWTRGAFLKGRDFLYRVKTEEGVFEAASHHLVLCFDGEYRKVSDLYAGQNLLDRKHGISTIESIEQQDFPQDYWDMQVADTNNYITADGCVHHNSGKSVGCCMEGFLIGQNMIPCADGWKKSKGLVVRNTLPELESTTMKTWLEWFPEEKFGKMRRKPPYEHVIKIPSIKLYMEVMFLALDKAEDVKKLLSYEGTWIWFNEAREINYEIVSAATGRVGRYPSMREAPQEIKDLGVEGIKFVQELTVNPDPDVAAKAVGLKKKDVAKIQAMPGFDTALKWMLQRYIIMDTNPPDDEHWWYRMAENDEWAVDQRGEKVDPASIPVHNQWKFFSQPSGLSDNAENIENLKGGRNYYLSMLGGKSKEWINIYVHGAYGFVKHGLPVYGESYDDDRNSSDDININPAGRIYYGIDASGRHPAVVFLQRTMRGQWQAVHELCVQDQIGMGAKSFAKLLVAEINLMFPNNEIMDPWGDPAGDWKTQNDENTYFDILRSEGIHVRSSPALRIPDRVETVRHILESNIDKSPRLVVSRKCKILRRGFNGGYHYRKVSTSSGQGERFDPKPEKNRFSDVHDALQYVLTGAGEMREMKRGQGRERQMVVAKTGSNVFT